MKRLGRLKVNLKNDTAIGNPPHSFSAELYEEMPALCVVVDKDLVIRNINQFGCSQLGYLKDEVIDKPIYFLTADRDREVLTNKLKNYLISPDNRLSRFEVTLYRDGGSEHWIRVTAQKKELGDGETILLLVLEDRTEIKYLIRELEQKSTTDPLTGLCNRRLFDKELEQLVVSAQKHPNLHTLCYLDLDQFKSINDSTGHHAGDELLKSVAQLLQKVVRADDLVARLGGDEFGLILRKCGIVEAEKICEKIISQLSKNRFYWEGEVFTVGASIGLLPVDNSSSSAADLLRQVDSACYTAKHRGRNCTHVFSPSDLETERRGELMRWLPRLHWAFESDSFVLYRQKIVPIDSRDREPDNYEILVRMIDQDAHLIPPGTFIPAAEHYGVASKLDTWVTKKAISLAKKEHQAIETEHRPIYFINLSGLTFGDKKFLSEVTFLLKESLNNNAFFNFEICFEITETAAIQNMNAAIEFMLHFRKYGCLFALDDFGTGFSSFSYLKSLPVDFVKIDGAFIRTLTKGSSEVAIVKAIDDVAKAFGKRTIAEHIETKETLDELSQLGVDFAQGYYLDKPTEFIS